jgi:DNA-binding IclR family transcriptional regulator
MLESSRKFLTSLHKGLDILCCFDFTRTCLSAQEISDRLDLPLSTTYKYLESLQEKGFLVRNRETKNYELGLMLFRLGNVTGSRMKLVNIALPHMKALSAGSGETVLLTVISGREVVCVERVETDGRIRVSLERGSSLPLHAGASSKILLAYQEESFLDALLCEHPSLVKFTERTVIDPVLLKQELLTIRRQGFAFSDQEVDVGVRALGSAVFNHRAEVVAGLSIAAPGERMNDDALPGLIRLVREAAEKVSRDLGYGYDEPGLRSGPARAVRRRRRMDEREAGHR